LDDVQVAAEHRRAQHRPGGDERALHGLGLLPKHAQCQHIIHGAGAGQHAAVLVQRRADRLQHRRRGRRGRQQGAADGVAAQAVRGVQQVRAVVARALHPQRRAVPPQFERQTEPPGVARAAVRAAEADDLPADEAPARRQVHARGDARVHAGEGNGRLRQPFELRALVDAQGLRQARAGAGAAVQLAGGRRGEQHAGALTRLHGDVEPVAAHHAARRVQQVDMTGAVRAFRMERPLHGKGAAVLAPGQHGALPLPGEAQVEARLPAVRRFSVGACAHAPAARRAAAVPRSRRPAPARRATADAAADPAGRRAARARGARPPPAAARRRAGKGLSIAVSLQVSQGCFSHE
jgi:hypothetical protein